MNQVQCDTAQQWIVEDLDEGLEECKAAVLDGHLRTCSTCRSFKEETSALMSLLPGDAPAEPDENFWVQYRSSLHAKLQEKAESRRSFWRFDWKIALLAACAALILFAVFPANLFREPPTQTQQRYDATTASDIMSELRDVYGPVPAEIPRTPISTDQPLIKGYTGELITSPELMTWYDLDAATNAYAF